MKLKSRILISLLTISAAVYAGQELLTSGAHGDTFTSSDIVSGGAYKGAIVTLAVPVGTGGSGVTLTPKIQGKDYSGNYFDIATGVASSASGYTTALYVYPGLASTATTFNAALPDIWRTVVTQSATTVSFTYTVNVNTLK